jgi:chemotaxis signal transduction protein
VSRDDRARRMLEERAAALARPKDEAAEQASTDVVVMSVAGRRYAIKTRHVRRVVPATSMSRLPGSAGQLVGLVPVEGDAVPVADLAALVGLAAGGAARPLAVVLGGHEPSVGLLVDEVIAATTMPDADLRLGETEGAQHRGVELGVTSAGVVLLDGPALLTDERLNTSTSPATPGPPTGS